LQPVETQCPGCGDFIAQGSSYCATCGAQLSGERTSPSRRLIAWLIFLCVVVLLILVNLVFIFIKQWLSEGERQEVKVLSELHDAHP
jgi:predicted nucleic acid-binding Zn ribbon protein